MTIAAFGIYIFLKVIIREGSAARIMLPTIKPQLLICSTGIQKSQDFPERWITRWGGTFYQVHSRAFVYIHFYSAPFFKPLKIRVDYLETFEKYSTGQHTRPLVQFGPLECVNDGPVEQTRLTNLSSITRLFNQVNVRFLKI